MDDRADLERLLAEMRAGNHSVEAVFLDSVYTELKRIARRLHSAERAGHTLQPTALVNEAYLRLFGGKDPAWNNAQEFFASAVRAMRQVLIDYARRRKAKRREGIRESLDEQHLPGSAGNYAWVEIDLALDKLKAHDSRAAGVAELHLFCGLNFREIGELSNSSTESARQDWLFAEAWLKRELGGSLHADA